MASFLNPNDPDLSRTKATLIDWLKAAKKLAPEATVTVSEQTCSEPSCVHAETIFCVEMASERVFYTIAKPLVFVRKWDILATLPKAITTQPHRHG